VREHEDDSRRFTAGTTLVSKPSSDTASVEPTAGGVKANVPSGPVATVAVTTSPLRN
jgi:hypothetical protein